MQVNILETNVLHFCVDTKKKEVRITHTIWALVFSLHIKDGHTP